MKFGRFDFAAFALFMAYAACSLAVPVVLVELARDLDFALESGGMSKGGALQLGRSIPMVAAMLCSGFVAARFGLRRSLGMAALMMSAGIMLAALSPWYGMLFLVLILAGFGEGWVEGLGTPLVQELHVNDEPGRYINFAHAFWSIGIFLLVPVIGLLLWLEVSWRLVVVGVGLLTLAPAAMLLLPGCSRVARLEGRGSLEIRTTVARTMAILRRRRFWLFFAAMFVAGGGEFCLTFWCATLLRLEYGASALLGGVGTAVFAAGMMIGRTGSGVLVKQRQLPLLVIMAAAAGTVITALFPFTHHLAAILALLFLGGLATAPFWPSVQSYCADRMPEVDSTLLFVLLSCAGIPGCGIFTAVLGFLGDLYGLRLSFFLIPGCYLLLLLLIGADYWLLGGRQTVRAPAERN